MKALTAQSEAGRPSGVLRQAIGDAARSIEALSRSVPAGRASLAAVTGIDGSGKGYVSALLADALRQAGRSVALINIDGWLNLPEARFCRANPGEHFYRHAIRFDEMFEQLVLPLRRRRSVRVEVDFAEETATAFRKHLYEFAGIDIIVLEGIYLLKRRFQRLYDVSFWIECSFETALARAIARAQEGLTPEATIAAYRTIYFPAQEIHFALDEPRDAATAIIENESPNPGGIEGLTAKTRASRSRR